MTGGSLVWVSDTLFIVDDLIKVVYHELDQRFNLFTLPFKSLTSE